MRETVGKICVSITENEVAEALAVATGVGDRADVLEIRLDYLAEPQIKAFVEQIKVPLLFTCRPVWEGGLFKGSEEARVALLEEAVNSGAAFVDIELRTEEQLRQGLVVEARKAGVQSIVSWHDFKATASDRALESILQEQVRSGADIGKIVTTARGFQEVLRVLKLQGLAAETGFPLCAFCMGRTGMISRVATLELGGFMSYAAPDGAQSAAPGQLPLSAMRTIMEFFDDRD